MNLMFQSYHRNLKNFSQKKKLKINDINVSTNGIYLSAYIISIFKLT